MSISLILDMAASGHPDRAAMTVGGRSLTYADFARRVARVSQVLTEREARHVVFVGNSSLELPTLLLAAAHAGIPFVPVNYRLSTEQLAALISRIDTPVVVVDEQYADALGAHFAVLTTRELAERVDAATGPCDAPAADVGADDAAVVLFTSGTTSEPKGVVLRHGHLLSYVMGTVEFASADETDGALISVPPYHIAGIGTILTNLYAGRRLIYLPTFDPTAWLTLVRNEGATSAMLVPTMLDRIVTTLDGHDASVPTLRSLSYGGARMPLPTLEAALRCFPTTGFVNAYGLTETSSTIALLGPDDHRNAFESTDDAVRARLSSIGRAVPGIEIELRGPAGDVVTTAGEQGELWVRGPQVSGEYMGIGSVLDENGWFPTRDLAYLDDDGFIFIVGRNDDTIIRGGENIAPAEIEDVAIHHPAVRSVVVIGVPDDHWGQASVAVVVPEPGTHPDEADIRDFVRSRLRSSRTPDRVVFWSELPTTATGKILRKNIIADLMQADITADA